MIKKHFKILNELFNSLKTLLRVFFWGGTPLHLGIYMPELHICKTKDELATVLVLKEQANSSTA